MNVSRRTVLLVGAGTAVSSIAALTTRVDDKPVPPEKPLTNVLYESPGSRVLLPAGQHGGGAGANTAYPLSRAVVTATLTYEAQFEAPFDWSLGGKLPGLVGVTPGASPTLPTGGNPDPDNLGWSGRFMWLTPAAGSWEQPDGSRRRATGPAEIVGYVYHPGQRDLFGDNIWTGYVPPVGAWFPVEAHYELNTPGRADGVLEISLGGKKLVDRRDFVYRTRRDVRITHFLDARFAGGSTDEWASATNRWIDVRNVEVTTP